MPQFEDYAETEYQQTEYQESDTELEGGEEEGGVTKGRGDALPVTHTTLSTSGEVDEADPRASLPDEVLEVLRSRWGAWKQAEKRERRMIWKIIIQDLRLQQHHRKMDQVEWQSRLKVSVRWNKCTRRKADIHRPTWHGCIAKAE